MRNGGQCPLTFAAAFVCAFPVAGNAQNEGRSGRMATRSPFLLGLVFSSLKSHSSLYTREEWLIAPPPPTKTEFEVSFTSNSPHFSGSDHRNPKTNVCNSISSLTGFSERGSGGNLFFSKKRFPPASPHRSPTVHFFFIASTTIATPTTEKTVQLAKTADQPK